MLNLSSNYRKAKVTNEDYAHSQHADAMFRELNVSSQVKFYHKGFWHAHRNPLHDFRQLKTLLTFVVSQMWPDQA